jgi:hypothetical protein
VLLSSGWVFMSIAPFARCVLTSADGSPSA